MLHREVASLKLFRMVSVVDRRRHAGSAVEARDIDLYARRLRNVSCYRSQVQQTLASGDAEFDRSKRFLSSLPCLV
jgi:hypothetical protein